MVSQAGGAAHHDVALCAHCPAWLAHAVHVHHACAHVIPRLPAPSGYLPSFWIKLRLMAVPAGNSALAQALERGVLGGVPVGVTVGLLATFVAVACIIAADTGAFFFGKAFGRTQARRRRRCRRRWSARAYVHMPWLLLLALVLP